jgi:hypothetical protein
MNLLLCFFVLLLTFSSFEEIEYQKLAGAFKYASLNSIFSNPRDISSSVMPPVPVALDQTDRGAEVRQPPEDNPTALPAPLPQIISIDAYKDRRILRLDSNKMFYGRGASLTPSGRSCLRSIAVFLRKLQCRVIVAESNERGNALDRSAQIVRFLNEQAQVPMDALCLAAPGAAMSSGGTGESVVEISLLAWKVY